VAHEGLAVVGAIGILAVIPAMSIQYREFLDRGGLRSSIRVTVAVSAISLALWVVISAFIPDAWGSPLEYPTAALAAVSGFLASLTVRDTTSRPLPAIFFAVGWTVFVFSPVALVVLFPVSVGIPIAAGPLDLGGALPVQVAVGASALVVLTVARGWAIESRVHARPRNWLLLLCALIVWAGWLVGFVGLELEVDSVITPRIIVNTVIAPLCAVIGWLVGQRVVTASNSVSGGVGGLLCGIVAISAGSAYFQPLGAAVTGIAAGFACSVFIYRRIRKTGRHTWFIVGAHLIAAGVGLVAVGLFGGSIGFIYDGQPTLVQVQVLSVVGVVVWAGVVSALLWLALRRAARASSPAMEVSDPAENPRA
jgi:Amt family ammonium transporter